MKKFIIIYLVSLIVIVSSNSYCEDILLPEGSIPINETNPADTVESPDPSAVGPDTSSGSAISLDPGTSSGSAIDVDPDTSSGSAISLDPDTVPDSDIDNVVDSSADTNNSGKDGSVAAAAAGAAAQQSVIVSPVSYDFGSVTPGTAKTFQTKVTVTSVNSRWNLSVTGTNFNNGSSTIPPERITLTVLSTGQTFELKTTSVTLLANQIKTGSKGFDVYIDYQINLTASDPIGNNYADSITFTVS